MSASLVGSEMCIRDSGRTAHAHAHARTLTPTDGRTDGRAHARTDGWTVSYTHLTLPTICSV
eukprot:4502695-Alexandrium_andersonii.AAC.1